MATKIVKCAKCNTDNTGLENFCRNCGNTLPAGNFDQQNHQNQQMQPPAGGGAQQLAGADKKIVAGICGILLGGFGIHKFVLGYQQEGIYMLAAYIIGLVLSVITCGVAIPIVMAVGIVGLVEGIIYLTKSDEEFVNTYIINKKPWF